MSSRTRESLNAFENRVFHSCNICTCRLHVVLCPARTGTVLLRRMELNLPRPVRPVEWRRFLHKILRRADGAMPPVRLLDARPAIRRRAPLQFAQILNLPCPKKTGACAPVLFASEEPVHHSFVTGSVIASSSGFFGLNSLAGRTRPSSPIWSMSQ